MAQWMKRVLMTAPGEMRVETVAKAMARPGEAVVKVAHCGVCGSDLTIYRGKHPWAICPLVMGHEFSGIIETPAPGPAALRVGTRVAVIPHRVCGKCPACAARRFNLCEKLRCMGAEADGAHAEYVSVPADMLTPLADNVSLEDAALFEPAGVALHAVRRARVEGKRVLVVGAGPIGLFALQAARASGAKEVFIADLDSWRLSLARPFSPAAAIALNGAPLEEALGRAGVSSGDIDVFVECVGLDGRALNDILRVARRGTEIVAAGVLQREYALPNLPDFIQHELTLLGTTMYTPEDFRLAAQWFSDGRMSGRGLITHRFRLEQVPDVFHFMEEKKEPYLKIMLAVNGKEV